MTNTATAATDSKSGSVAPVNVLHIDLSSSEEEEESSVEGRGPTSSETRIAAPPSVHRSRPCPIRFPSSARRPNSSNSDSAGGRAAADGGNSSSRRSGDRRDSASGNVRRTGYARGRPERRASPVLSISRRTADASAPPRSSRITAGTATGRMNLSSRTVARTSVQRGSNSILESAVAAGRAAARRDNVGLETTSTLRRSSRRRRSSSSPSPSSNRRSHQRRRTNNNDSSPAAAAEINNSASTTTGNSEVLDSVGATTELQQQIQNGSAPPNPPSAATASGSGSNSAAVTTTISTATATTATTATATTATTLTAATRSNSSEDSKPAARPRVKDDADNDDNDDDDDDQDKKKAAVATTTSDDTMAPATAVNVQQVCNICFEPTAVFSLACSNKCATTICALCLSQITLKRKGISLDHRTGGGFHTRNEETKIKCPLNCSSTNTVSHYCSLLMTPDAPQVLMPLILPYGWNYERPARSPQEFLKMTPIFNKRLEHLHAKRCGLQLQLDSVNYRLMDSNDRLTRQIYSSVAAKKKLQTQVKVDTKERASLMNQLEAVKIPSWALDWTLTEEVPPHSEGMRADTAIGVDDDDDSDEEDAVPIVVGVVNAPAAPGNDEDDDDDADDRDDAVDDNDEEDD